ncbi:basic salivary proline-rich protein 2-like [Grammomys surdaster]|uniref:basic salivary proline-rich protein 2-like n=1 Tax=Grammomys surdaster TaxID=491861 RepID=UPI00109EE45E|nr:basic salivary proline-rich protein 2-like [Grammomys surdaster]
MLMDAGCKCLSPRTTRDAETRHPAQAQAPGHRKTRVYALKSSPRPPRSRRPRNPPALTGPPSDRTRCPLAHGPGPQASAQPQSPSLSSPHPDPTGNGGPRNGDYVRLGGVARDPPPPPSTRARERPAPAPPPPPETKQPREPRPPHRPRRAARPAGGRRLTPRRDKEGGGGAAAHDTREPTGRPGARSTRGARVANPQAFPYGSPKPPSTGTPTAEARSGGNGGGGGGEPGQRSPADHGRPERAPTAEGGPGPAPPSAARPALLTARVRRCLPAAPPPTVGHC